MVKCTLTSSWWVSLKCVLSNGNKWNLTTRKIGKQCLWVLLTLKFKKNDPSCCLTHFFSLPPRITMYNYLFQIFRLSGCQFFSCCCCCCCLPRKNYSTFDIHADDEAPNFKYNASSDRWVFVVVVVILPQLWFIFTTTRADWIYIL